MVLLIEAGQMTASDYVPTHPDLLLASEGASTDAVRLVTPTGKCVLSRIAPTASEAGGEMRYPGAVPRAIGRLAIRSKSASYFGRTVPHR